MCQVPLPNPVQLNTYSHDLNILCTNNNSWQINEKNIRSDDTRLNRTLQKI